MRSPFALALMAVACGPSGPPPDYVSGTRLHAEVWVAEGGDRQIHGVFDALRGEECAFALAEDGVMRCLPTNIAHVDASSMYSDSACTQRVVDVTVSPVPRYATFNAPCDGAGVWELGPVLASDTIYEKSSGACSAQSAGASTYVSLGTPVPASAFVAVTLERDDRTSDLAMQFFVGEDGARVPFGAYDRTREITCGPMRGIDDRCAPLHAWSAGQTVYGDAACQTPIEVLLPGPSTCNLSDPVWFPRDELSSLAMIDVPNPAEPSCPSAYVPTFVEAVPVPPNTPFWIGGGGSGSCTPTTLGPLESHVSGARVANETFPAIAHASAGVARLRARVATAATGERLYVEGFFDAQLNVPCHVALAEDGSLRCLPVVSTDAEYSVMYTDAQCTTPVVGVMYDGCDPPAWLEAWHEDAGVVSTRIVQLGASIAPPSTLYADYGSGRCLGGGGGTGSYFAATIASPDTFAPLADVTEE